MTDKILIDCGRLSQHNSMLFKQTMNGMARHTDCIFCELYSSLDKVIDYEKNLRLCGYAACFNT